MQVVRQLCPTWSSIDVARVKEEDEQAILLMLTDGVQILKSVGQVFSTAAFDGMMQPNPPSVKVGLSIDSNLVEISPIADEVPMNEVGALLDSYRRKRRYHRLKNGTFVDLKEADLHELDQVSTDLDLSEKQLDSGIIKIPGYQAFLLDSQVDDEGKSASFVDYVNDVKIVDPKRYEVPERLKTVLTFPVETMALLTRDGDVMDAEWGDFTAQMYAEGHSFFTYMSDNADSLSSCCRLRNEIQDNGFSYTLGAGGVSTGSKSVLTINLNRCIQHAANAGLPHLSFLEGVVDLVHKVQMAYNENLKDLYNKGMLPLERLSIDRSSHFILQ